jgi:hypothetical protein
MGSRVVAGMGRDWTYSAAVGWMESEVVRVAVHDSSRVCGSRQNPSSQAVMKEPQCGRLSQNAWAERAASVEAQHRIADSLASNSCRGRTGLPQRTTPTHSRRRLSSGADARRSEVASTRRVSVQGNRPCSRAPSVSRPLLVITPANGYAGHPVSAYEGLHMAAIGLEEAAGVIAQRGTSCLSRRQPSTGQEPNLRAGLSWPGASPDREHAGEYATIRALPARLLRPCESCCRRSRWRLHDA